VRIRAGQRPGIIAAAAAIAVVALLFGCSSSQEPVNPGPTGTQEEINSYYENHYFREFFAKNDGAVRYGDLDPKTRTSLRDRGEYLVNGPAACGACHGRALSGGGVFQDRFGPVHAANITPAATGIAGWDIRDVIGALRASMTPSGTPLSIDLHSTYRWLSDADAKAIAVYLLSLKPIENEVERRTLGVFERKSWGLFSRYREVEGYVPSPPRSNSAPYGRYLSYHVAGCYGCHTPKGGLIDDAPAFSGSDYADHGIVASFGELFSLLVPKKEETLKQEDESTMRLLSHEGQKEYLGSEYDGAAPRPAAPEPKNSVIGESDKYDAAVESGTLPLTGPDIRGSSEKGLLSWTKKDLIQYLSSGKTPAGDVKDGRVCPWPYFQRMSDGDKEAVANFIKNL